MSLAGQNRASMSRPHCDACSVSMWLLSIKLVDRGLELRTYECARCGEAQAVLMKAGSQEGVDLGVLANESAPRRNSSAGATDGASAHQLAERKAASIQHDPPMPTDTDGLRTWAEAYFASSDKAR